MVLIVFTSFKWSE